jgi:hypothetical protein
MIRLEKIKWFLVLYILVFSTTLVRSQFDSLPSKKISFHTLTSEYLPSWHLEVINFNLGTELLLKKSKAVCINLGYLSNQKSTSGDFFNVGIYSSKGYRVQIEIKHYLKRKKLIEPLMLVFWPHLLQYKSQTLQNSGYYLSGLMSYQYTSSERTETIANEYNSTNQSQFMSSIYNVNRNSVSLIAKAGYQCIKSFGLLIDVSFGFGAQWLDTKTVGKQSDNFSIEFPWAKPFDTRQGIFPQVRYQIKLGWAF